MKHSISIIKSSLEIQKDDENGLKVIGVIYRIENDKIIFDKGEGG